METENKKNITPIIYTTILIVATVLVIMFLAIPSFKKLKTNSYNFAAANSNYTDGAKYITDIETAYAKLEANQNAVDLLNTASPTSPDIAGALVQIDGLTSESGLNLNALTPSWGENGEIKISAIVSGSYDGLEKFLQGLENNLRPFQISTISVTAYEGSDGQILTAGNYAIEITYAGGETPEVSESQGATGEDAITVSSEGGL